MKTENPIQTKSYAFALRIVKLYRFLCDEKKEFVLSKQIVRSGTSIGANVEEAIGGQSKQGLPFEDEHCLQGSSRDPLLASIAP